MRLELGTEIECGGEKFGELADVVIDPLSRQVTHIVVRPRQEAARLAPIGLIRPHGERGLSLICSPEEAKKLDAVQDFAYLRVGELPVDDPDWDVGIERVLALPYYETGEPLGYAPEEGIGIAYDRVPKGEVEIRRSSEVIASDGSLVGHVDGLLVDDDQHVTHVVLERGHLWRRRDVTIPLGAVAKVETDTVTLSLTKSELEQLPAVPVRRWLR
jgi:sporulation protein YlmC with PRC-barrel domain